MALLPLLLLFAAMYFMMIRPQQRRIRQHQALVASLRPGDEVVTAGGIFGTITRLDSEAVDVEVSPGVNLRVLRASITRRLGDEASFGAGADDLAGDDVAEMDDPRLELEERAGDPADPGPTGPDAGPGRPVNGNGHEASR